MKKLVPLALATLLVCGCGSNPMVSFFKESFGSGYAPLKTNSFVKDLQLSVPENLEQPLGGGVSISPDGQRYAYTVDKQLFIGKVGHPAEAHGMGCGYQWWSPDGTKLAYAVQTVWGKIQRFDLMVLEVESGKTTSIRSDLSATYPWLAWAPDGKSVLFTELTNTGLTTLEAGNTLLFRHFLDQTDSQQVTEIPNLVSPPISWSPDSTQIVYAKANSAFTSGLDLLLRSLDAGTQTVIARVPGDAHMVWYENTIGYLANVGESYSGEYTFNRIGVPDGTKESKAFSLEKTDSQGHYSTADALSPNGKWCLVLRDDRPLYARELLTDRQIQVASGRATILGWTADSQAAFAMTEKGGVRHFYRIQVER